MCQYGAASSPGKMSGASSGDEHNLSVEGIAPGLDGLQRGEPLGGDGGGCPDCAWLTDSGPRGGGVWVIRVRL